MLFLSSVQFFNINFFKRFIQEYDLSVKQFTVRIRIRSDVLLSLIIMSKLFAKVISR